MHINSWKVNQIKYTTNSLTKQKSIPFCPFRWKATDGDDYTKEVLGQDVFNYTQKWVDVVIHDQDKYEMWEYAWKYIGK